MILIDPRAGSGELDPLFNAYDVLHVLAGPPERDETGKEIYRADVSFVGNGPEGDVLVGVEVKKLGDMIQCLKDKRFSGHQLPGLLENYEFPYLCIQGIWNVGLTGELLKLNGRGFTPFYYGTRGVMYSELSGYLTSLELRAVAGSGERLRVHRTNDAKETVAWLVGLWKNFNEKSWGQHHAHDEVYAPGVTPSKRKPGMVRREVSLMEKMICQIPSLDRMAKYVAQKFPMPEDFATITVESLARIDVEVDGKVGKKLQKLGKVRAAKILPLLRRNGA